MNSRIRNRTLGATALLALLFGSAACGNETVNDPGTQPGFGARVYPPSPPVARGGISADTAERRAAAQQERLDRASTARWDRSTQIENKLEYAGHPSRP